MKSPVFIIGFICIALIQTLGYPWLSWVGQPLPLALVALTFFSLYSNQLLWPAIALGVTLDLSGVSILGLWTLWYVLIAISLTRLNQTPIWWRSLAWLLVVLLFQPFYAQIGSSINWLTDLQIGVGQSLGVAVILAVPYWIISRRQFQSTEPLLLRLRKMDAR